MKMKQEGLIRAIKASNVNEQIVEGKYLKYGQAGYYSGAILHAGSKE